MRDHLALSQLVDRDVVAFESEPFPEHIRYAASNLRRTLLKKFLPKKDAVSCATDRAALTFLQANARARVWKWSWGDQKMDEVLQRTRRQLDNFFHDGPNLLFSSYLPILEKGRTGPGSSLVSDGQSFYAKLGSSPQLTTTSLDLYYLYRAYSALFPTWEAGESLRASQSSSSVRIVETSKMTFVPKNVDTDRAICVEPSVNMFMQLGLEGVLRERLRQLWGINLETQPEYNRVLARIGSRDGDYATLDLSSASDLISVELCRQTLPAYVFDTLLEMRVKATTIPEYGLNVDLGMMSTMGNGFTFPIMTILLSSIVRACYATLGIRIADNRQSVATHAIVPGNWGVFGDDIIVVREAYDLVVETLHAMGLQVNVAKSFNTGPFRESCGHDYFHGHDVRGVYLKRLASRQDVAVAANLLNDWSFRTGIPLPCVKELIEGENLPFVPYHDGNDAGVRVPSSIFKGKVKFQKVLYRAFEARPISYRIGDGEIHHPRSGRRWFYNGPMLLLSLLKGELRNGKISVRQNGVHYRTRKRITPFWDYAPASVWFKPRADWPRWKAAVEGNLNPEA